MNYPPVPDLEKPQYAPIFMKWFSLTSKTSMQSPRKESACERQL